MIGLVISVLVPLFLSIIGAVFAYYGWQGYRQRSKSKEGSVPAVGFVVEMVPTYINGRKFYNPKVAFTTHRGQNVVFVSDSGASWKTFQINQQIEIFYKPENPHQAGIKSDTSANLLYPVLMILGGLMAVGMLFFAVIEVFVFYVILTK